MRPWRHVVKSAVLMVCTPEDRDELRTKGGISQVVGHWRQDVEVCVYGMCMAQVTDCVKAGSSWDHNSSDVWVRCLAFKV